MATAVARWWCRSAAAVGRPLRLHPRAGGWGLTAVAAAAGSSGLLAAAALAEPEFVEDAASARLQVWLSAHGASVGRGVRFGHCPDAGKGRGVFEDRRSLLGGDDGGDEDQLVQLPAPLVLTADRAMAALPGLRALRQQTEGEANALAATLGSAAATDALVLTLFVLHARLLPAVRVGGPVPDWGDFIASLPTEFDLPAGWDWGSVDDGSEGGMYYGSSATACLEGTPLGEAAEAKRRWLGALDGALRPSLRSAGLGELAIALDERTEAAALLRWADAVVWSRGVGVPTHRDGRDGGSTGAAWEPEPELSLLPGIDMANHHASEGSAEVAASWQPISMEEGGGVELLRLRPRGRSGGEGRGGEMLLLREVTISYGDKPSEE